MRHIRTPSEINAEARLHLEAGFGQVWVEGEISNLSRPASGHLYFSLKDDRAQISCALFRGNARGLDFRPDNGQQVQARGRLSIYEPSGRYQLILDRLEAAGEGQLRAAFEALKGRLAKEGLFDADLKQPLPAFPRRIAVVTSPSGAVIRDILQVLSRRWPAAAVRLYPVPVQGADAVPAIVRALKAANAHAWAQAIILGRGGGSLEDLWAFNEEAVARAVFASDLPVVSAVGHETDTSITDFVADLRAPTPSAAAELLTPDRREVSRTLEARRDALARRWQQGFLRRSQQVDHLAHRLGQQHPRRQVERLAERLLHSRARLAATGQRMTALRRQQLDALATRLRSDVSRLLPDRQRRLQSLARTLHAVSPLPTLERGYAVVTDADSGHAVASIAQVKPGLSLSTQLLDGRIVSRVESTTPERLADPDATD